MRIFLSHSSGDKPFVRKVRLALSPYVESSWLDEIELRPGDSLYGKIQTGIVESTHVIAVLSKTSIDSKWVNTELLAFFAAEDEDDEVKVIPLVIDDVPLPPFISHRLQIRNLDDHISPNSISELLKAIFKSKTVLTATLDIEEPYLFPSLTDEFLEASSNVREGNIIFVFDHTMLDDLCLAHLGIHEDEYDERFRLAWPRHFSLFSLFIPKLGSYIYKIYGRDIGAPAELNRLITTVWHLVSLSLLNKLHSLEYIEILDKLPKVREELDCVAIFAKEHFKNHSYGVVANKWQHHLNLSLDDCYDLGFIATEGFYNMTHITVPKSSMSGIDFTVHGNTVPSEEFMPYVWVKHVLPLIIAKSITEGSYTTSSLQEIVSSTGIEIENYQRFGIE